MPRLSLFSSSALSEMEATLANISLRVITIGVISFLLVYFPNYFFLESVTAEQSSRILGMLGYPSSVHLLGSAILLNGFEVTRECTGIQAIVPIVMFFGSIRQVRNSRRFLAALCVGSLIYSENIIRIVLELALYSDKILPWSVIHDDFGFGFSVISVILSLFLAGKILWTDGVQDLMKTLI